MNRLDSFLEDLRRALEPVPKGIADEAVQYYADYFADARQAGVSEDEILRRTGTVDQIAGAIKDDLAVTAAESQLGPVRLLRLSRRFLGRSGREARKPRMVGAARAARGTSLAMASIFPLAAAIILYLTAFAVLAATTAIAIALIVNITGHPELAANDRYAQIGLAVGLGSLGLLLALLIQRAGHAFSRMTLAIFRRISSHPRPAAMTRTAVAKPVAPILPANPELPAAAAEQVRTDAPDPMTTDPAEPSNPDRAMDRYMPVPGPAIAASDTAGTVPAAAKLENRTTVADFARETATERATAALATRRRRRRTLWRFLLVALLVLALAGFTISTIYGLPQTYFQLWNSQRPVGTQTASQMVTENPVRKLTIRTLNTDILVQPSSSRYVHYRYEPLPYVALEESRVYRDSAGIIGEVVLQERANGRLPLFELLSAHEGTTVLTVNVPVNSEFELQVESNGGNIDIQVPTRMLIARTGSGDIRIHGRQQMPGDQVHSARGTVTWFS